MKSWGQIIFAGLLGAAMIGFIVWLTYHNWSECRQFHDFWYCLQTLG